MSQTQIICLTKKNGILLVFGFIRTLSKKLNTQIPISLIELIVEWYYLQYQILQFSVIYCSGNSFSFHKNKTLVIKTRPSGRNWDDHKYILADIEALYEGIHCFRIQTEAICSGWISYGVSEKVHLNDDSYDSSNSWNVAWNHWSMGCRNCKHSEPKSKRFLKFLGGKTQVDVLLDCDEGTMEVKLISPPPGSGENYPELKCWDMPSRNNNYLGNKIFAGYVPQFNVYTKGISLRIAKINPDWFGDGQSFDIFEDK